MTQLSIELEPEVAERPEAVAPGKSRRRSEFIRMAIRKALWELEEQATAEAYARQPDAAADVYLDPRVWERRPTGARKKKARR